MHCPGNGVNQNGPETQETDGFDEIRYLRNTLEDADNRERIARELKDQRWTMSVMQSHLLETNKFCFLKSSQFPDNVFLSAFNIPHGISLSDGDQVDVIISVKNDPKRNKWGYVANVVGKCESAATSSFTAEQVPTPLPPKWHNAWDGILAALILYSRGLSNATTVEQILKRMSQSGAPIDGLSGFNSDPSNMNRLIRAKNIVGRIIGGEKSSGCAQEYHRIFDLPQPAWQTLKKLADARLACEGIFVDEICKNVQLQTRPVGKKTTTKKRPKKTNRIKKAPPPSRNESLDSLEKQKLAVASASNFGSKEAFMAIYIDESWPSDEKNKGVIGGLVWRGYQPDYAILPHIATHKRASATGIDAMNKLLGCNRALPFIMPIKTYSFIAQKDYFDLVVSALKVLLGWLLPQLGEKCKIRILLEGIGNRPEGTDRTDYLKGVLEEARLINPHRFSRWEVELMKWSAKDEEYVPYADLVAYLGLEHNEINRELGRKADYRNWPGYVPLSLELVPRLTRLDQLEATGNVDDVLDFVANMHGTELCNVVLDDLKIRMAERPELQRRLVEKLERRFENKTRNISALRKQTAAVKMLVSESHENTPARQQLLWSLIDIQNANHHGHPEKAFQAAGTYSRLRPIVQPHDRELIVYTDLNFAVHLNDQFKFHEAIQVNQNLLDDPGFEHLSPLARGRVLSSLGQTFSLTGQYLKSERCFAEAFTLLENAVAYEPGLSGDMDQSRVYRAINAMDGGFDEAVERLTNALGTITPQSAAEIAKSASIAEQYHHHLLVRSFWILKGQEPVVNSYIEHRHHWKTNPNHPWELINCYRALLLWESDDESLSAESSEWFDKAIEITQLEEHGATMRLIGAMIATSAACCLDDGQYIETAGKLITEAESKLPAAVQATAVLRGIIDNPDPEHIDKALAALPFNYH